MLKLKTLSKTYKEDVALQVKFRLAPYDELSIEALIMLVAECRSSRDWFGRAYVDGHIDMSTYSSHLSNLHAMLARAEGALFKKAVKCKKAGRAKAEGFSFTSSSMEHDGRPGEPQFSGTNRLAVERDDQQFTVSRCWMIR